MSTWFFTSDLHGQSDYYEQALALASERRPRALLVGGDLGPHAGGEGGVRRQRLFLEGFLVEFARRLREAVPGIELLLMPGNDDWAANHDVLERHHGEWWRSLHGRVVEVDGVAVAGSSYVPITPFGMKDWERWEDGEPESPLKLEGWVSDARGVHAFAFDPARRTPTLAAALDDLAAQCDPARTIFTCHSPARDTHCDVTNGGHHVGSRALRAFVERHQPPLLLSGHIHESPRVTGHWRDTIGATVTVNPGQFGHPRLAGVWFDPADPAGTLRHTTLSANGIPGTPAGSHGGGDA
ncbi:MAG: metallophosphoesterase [Candidatus Eisenbacteria bacterium]